MFVKFTHNFLKNKIGKVKLKINIFCGFALWEIIYWKMLWKDNRRYFFINYLKYITNNN